MKPFLKENFVLIAGLSLPLILTLVFIAAAGLKPPLKNPPVTPVIYAVNYYENTYSFDVTDKGGLEFTYTPPDTSRGEHCCPAIPRLYQYDPVTKKEDEIRLPEFDKDKKFKGLVEIAGDVSDTAESPDGWRFEYDYEYSEGNLMTYMFGGGSRYGSRNVLKKDYHRVPVSERRYENGRFIAWVLPESQP